MEKNEKIYDYLKRKLNAPEFNRKLSKIAKDLNLNQSTISRLSRGEILSPGLDVVQPLLDYFLASEKVKKPRIAKAEKNEQAHS